MSRKTLEVGDIVLIDHPSARELYYWTGYIMDSFQDKYLGKRLKVLILSPRGKSKPWIDYCGSEIGTGFQNIWGATIIKKLKKVKRK